jgi:hypothetical protein
VVDKEHLEQVVVMEQMEELAEAVVEKICLVLLVI